MKAKHLFLSLVAIFTFANLGCNNGELKGKKTVKSLATPPVDSTDVRGRAIRTFTLANGLKVLLVHDPQLSQSAAAMDVGVGYNFDPPEYQGLSHFLEHMLFLGTKKYPDVEEYKSYLSRNQGFGNAYTSDTRTNYFFQINNEAFREALDRFGQFFVAPLFDADFTDREKKAVNNEHSKNLQDDYRRVSRVIDEMFSPKNSNRTFGTGSVQTLKNVSRDVLIDHYNNYYSADVMNLAILSTLPLDEQEALVNSIFEEVPRRKVKSPPATTPLFEESALPKALYVKALNDRRMIDLTFEIPFGQKRYRYTKANAVIGSLFGYEGEGSLLSLLKKEELATGLMGSAGDMGTNGVLGVVIELSDKGHKARDRVLELFFAYVRHLKENVQLIRQFHEDHKASAQLGLQFGDPPQGGEYASLLATLMRLYPSDNLEEAASVPSDYSEEHILEILNHLTPEKMLVAHVSRDFETNRTEEHYGVEYRTEKLSSAQLKAYNQAALPSGAGQLTANQFIASPDKLTLKAPDERENPSILTSRDWSEVRFYQDKFYKSPQTFINLELITGLPFASTKNSLLARLYLIALEESLNEWSYPLKLVSLAGNSALKLNLTEEGIEIALASYSVNELENLLDIIQRMKNLKIDARYFDLIKNKYLRELQSREFSEAYMLAATERRQMRLETDFHPLRHVPFVKTISLAEVKLFAAQMLSEVGIRLAVYGNVEAEQWRDADQRILNALGARPIKKADWFKNKAVRWPDGKRLAYSVKSENNNNSAWWSIIQAGSVSAKTGAILKMADALLEVPYYAEMRTRQQLGYIVWSFSQTSRNHEFDFVIQSGDYGPEELARRSQQWLEATIEAIKELSDEDFKELKAAVYTRMKAPAESMADYFFDRVLSPLKSGLPVDYHKKVTDAVLETSKEQFIDMVTQIFTLKMGGQMSIYFTGANHGAPQIIPQDELVKSREEVLEMSGRF